MVHLKHFGVYGICIREGKLLCVRKNRGPYTGRYDLPGGSQDSGESLLDTLKREMLEETGFQVLSAVNNRIFDTFVQPEGEENVTHHIFAVYDVELDDSSAITIAETIDDGDKNDSAGIVWVKLSELTESNASPLILKILAPDLEASHYPNWHVLS
ncbi:NUDIX hydrolase [Streptococcus hillyeri]|uniref:NUDIX domain-containing protein n=1 Tax=Streptococcus hillyeri TaxID=2282420 RepID=A0A3L9DS60_9STRE|nr:NUDIX hydrolase [Streptococcus hillyeri]RLY04151.1 NUDIX domain-containing protein [Streptococcus hillyeri]